MTIQVYRHLDTVCIFCETKDWQGNLINPTGGVVVNIFDPDGNQVGDENIMTNLSTGKYVYYYNSLSTDKVGWWHYICKARDGSGELAKTAIIDGSFQLQ
jgi:hypothetical protein